MGIYLAEQTMAFFQAILLGAVFGLLYDAFRITRIAIPTGGWLVFAEDLLFCMLLALATFLFLMRTIDGQVRFFILIGEALGILLYFMTFSPLVMKVSSTIIGAVKAVIRFIIKWAILPIWQVIRSLAGLLLRPVLFLYGFFKKSAQRLKYRLKVRRKVLYNQLRGVFVRKVRKTKESCGHMARKKKKTRKSLLFRICIFAFVAYAAVLLIDMQVNLANRKQQLNELRIRHEIQRISNKELERQLAQGMDQAYIERIAREKLGYVAPDERVYIDISGS